MKTSFDVLRSLKRYVAIALGEDWEVRLQVEEGTFIRPAAIITDTPGGQSIDGPRRAMDIVQTFSINAFALPGATVMDSLAAASEVEETLVHAFRVGVGEGKAARVPLYDYDAVPVTDPSTSRNAPDYARILDLSVARVQAPTDELLFTVTVEVRLGWRRNADVPFTGRTATEIRFDIS